MGCPKIKKGNLIEVVWLDSYTEEANCWVTPREAGHSELVVARSVGYYIGKAKGLIRLAADQLYEEDKVTRVNRLMAIPRGCVTEIRRLK